MKTYTSESFDRLLVTGDVVLAHACGGPIARATRETIQDVFPQEGGTIWTDCLAVLQPSAKTGLAFLNDLLETNVAASNCLLVASANHLAKAPVSDESGEDQTERPAEIAAQPGEEARARLDGAG